MEKINDDDCDFDFPEVNPDDIIRRLNSFEEIRKCVINNEKVVYELLGIYPIYLKDNQVCLNLFGKNLQLENNELDSYLGKFYLVK